MKKVVLLILLAPFLGITQGKYSNQGKKLFKQGAQAYAEGRVDDAIASFKECVVQDPNFAEAHLNLATINYHREKFELALSYAKRAYRYNKYQPEVNVELGKAYLQAGNYDSSVVLLKRAVTEFNNTSEDVYVHLAMALNEIGDYPTAIDYLNKVITSNPQNAAALNARGTSFFFQEDYEAAEKDFKQALNIAPNESSIYTNLANLSIVMEKQTEAEEYLQKALETATSNEKVSLLILKGNNFRAAGDLDAAEEAFNEAFELDDNNASVLNNQASVLIDRDEYQLAWEKCNAALEIDNEMMEAYFNRGIANEMLRKPSEACLDWEQAFILGSVVAEEYLNSPACSE